MLPMDLLFRTCLSALTGVKCHVEVIKVFPYFLIVQIISSGRLGSMSSFARVLKVNHR